MASQHAPILKLKRKCSRHLEIIEHAVEIIWILKIKGNILFCCDIIDMHYSRIDVRSVQYNLKHFQIFKDYKILKN